MPGAVLIANRGEIACRIIGKARERGIRTIAVDPQADQDALHTELAYACSYTTLNPPHNAYG